MPKIVEKIGNFITLHPRTTTALFSVGLTLGIGLVLSYVAPTHDAFAALIRKKMFCPMITILHGGRTRASMNTTILVSLSLQQ